MLMRCASMRSCAVGVRRYSAPAPVSRDEQSPTVHPSLPLALVLVAFLFTGTMDYADAIATDAWRKHFRAVRPVISVFPPECAPNNAAGERLQWSIANRPDFQDWSYDCRYKPEEGTRT